jgi:hypothetical protein
MEVGDGPIDVKDGIEQNIHPDLVLLLPLGEETQLLEARLQQPLA